VLGVLAQAQPGQEKLLNYEVWAPCTTQVVAVSHVGRLSRPVQTLHYYCIGQVVMAVVKHQCCIGCSLLVLCKLFRWLGGLTMFICHSYPGFSVRWCRKSGVVSSEGLTHSVRICCTF
jgi:hypothetical protein